MALTLDQISQFVCGKVGQTDAASLALCYGYVNMRFRMVFESYPWRDSQIIPADVNTVSSQSYVLLPAGIDRVISIRCNGQMLEPTNSTLQIEINPTYFDVTGIPLYYEEYTEASDNSKRIRLFPIPNAILALRIIAKRTPNTLSSAGDTPILRNIDNVLIAYAMGDMLERQRQYGKAGEKFKEAGALLEVAQKLESEQTNAPRAAKNITVSGDSLLEMTDSVCAKTGTWSQESRILAKEFLRRNYQMLWDSELWPESCVAAKVNSDGQQIILPEYFERVLSVRPNPTAGYGLTPVDATIFMQIDPSIFEEESDAVAYQTLTPVAVHTFPPTNEKLVFVGTSASDKGNVFVRGETLGLEVSETVVLNGTTPVTSASTYDTPLTLAKGFTVGTVHVTGETSLIALQSLLPNERERKHMRLWLQPAPGVSEQALIIGKRKITPLVSDEDTPMLRKCANALISSAAGDLLEQLGKDSKSARERAAAALEALKDGELRQNARQPRVIPSVESCFSSFDSYADAWHVAKT